jgi:hypothetical protein
LKLAVLWCGIVAASIWCGHFYDAGGAVLFGGLGVGVATCFTIGLAILGLVHARSVGKIAAIVGLVVSSVVSPILAVTATETVADMTGVLPGESRWGVAWTAIWATAIAGGTFLMFIPIVIGIGRPPAQPRNR